MRKIIYAILVLLITSTLFFACSKLENEDLNNTSSFKVEGIVAFNTKTKKTYVKETNDLVSTEKAKEKFNKDYDIHLIKWSFICDKTMPAFANEKELKSYLLKNTKKTNGVFEFYIDNELVYSVKIIKGEKFNEKIIMGTKKTLNLTSKDYPCTYAGVRACAVEGIHNQNWFQMTQCVLEGVACVAEWYINCTIDNC
jgi:hypothetical protein